MQILIILVAAGVGWALAGRLGVPLIETPVDVGAYALATMLLFTESAHFSESREDLVAMVPPRLPAPQVFVAVTGIAGWPALSGYWLTKSAPPRGSVSRFCSMMFP